jgi:hypothetical protein
MFCDFPEILEFNFAFFQGLCVNKRTAHAHIRKHKNLILLISMQATHSRYENFLIAKMIANIASKPRPNENSAQQK